MLEHWIQPHNESALPHDYWSADRLGRNITSLSENPPRPGRRAAALIGADARWTKLIRRHLYRFTFRMQDIQFYDLGDLRRTDPDFVVGPLLELLSSNICPIIVGGNLGYLNTLRQVFTHQQRSFRPAVVHEGVPETLIIPGEGLSLIGVQHHLVPKSIPAHVQTLHLSTARNAMHEAETLIRDSNALIFDLTAMSTADLPAQKSFSSSGFCTEEGCALMRYSGLHDNTRALMITGHDPLSLQLDISANSTAQLIWYFLEGYNQCITEDPVRSAHCTMYTVHLDKYDTDFRFYKSERTGRWWVQLPGDHHDPVFPCTYRDYHSATNGQVSDRLIACTQNSLESSKQTL